MKKSFFTIIVILITLINPLSVFAQEDENESSEEIIETTTESSFELDLVPGIQSIFDKSIPLTLKIKSNVDTYKMQLRWKLPSNITTTSSGTTDWGSVTTDQEIETIITLKPQKPGTYNIVAEVQDWRTNNVDTISISLTFDNDLELSPQSDEYYRNQTAWFWAKIGIGIVILITISITGFFGVKAFKKWLDEG